jgi:hypothetical protein
MKVVWRKHREDFTNFVKLYEWSFKVLGWLTALGVLKFAFIKTSNTLFVVIYTGLLVALSSFPFAFYFELDMPKIRSFVLRRLVQRGPALIIAVIIAVSLNWAVTHVVDAIANIQLTASSKAY